jgi:hypothetical protein
VAVPTISTITPNLGHSGGQTLIEIDGTGFALPPAPPSVGVAPVPFPSVSVSIGGRMATQVAVVSSSLIYCLTPKGDPGAPVDVVLWNNDATGTLIPGEVVTAVAAYTFQRPDLTEESELARVVRAFIQEVKRQVHPNVSFSTHTDYDGDTGDLLNLAYVESMPAIILGNLDVPEDRIHAVNAPQEFTSGSGNFITRRPPVVVDVTMTLVGVTDNPITILNLMQAVRMFFKKNAWLELDRDATDATLGSVKYELDWSFAGGVAVSHQGDNSNVESFGGSVVIRGVLLEDMPGISRTKPAAVSAHYPHEATTGVGFVSAADESAVVLQAPQKKA